MSGRHVLEGMGHRARSITLAKLVVGWAVRRGAKWRAETPEGRPLTKYQFESDEAVRAWFDARLEGKS